MIGLGTIINSLAIIAGGIIGLFLGNRLKESLQKIITVAMGLSVFAMAVSGFVSKMVTPTGTTGTYLVIFSLTLGAIVGELINIDQKIEDFGVWLKQKTGNAKDAKFVDGFVTASLTVCIGAMAVVGAIMYGMNGDYSILLTKGILDFVIILVMAASLGKGCIFSFIPVFLFQGFITLIATFIAPLMSDLAINNISLVGNILIMCIGVNLLADGKYRIKVANLLPAIIFAVIAAFIPFIN